MKLKSAISFRRTICALAALAAGAGLAGPGLAATLQSNVTVQGDVVHLGDIFRDAGKYADRVVIQAPEPGRKVILNVNWLYRVARNYKVDWRPFSRLDQATVERASLLISTQQIRETLTTSLKSEIGRNETIDVDLDNRTLQFYLPAEASQSVKVQSLRVDPRSRRFSAVAIQRWSIFQRRLL